MPSERAVRISHTIIFTLTLIASIVALAISASLVAHYNADGYPPVHTRQWRDRIRIVLVASVWTTAATMVLIVGFLTLGKHRAFGIITHLVLAAIGFILYIIGVSSLTALTQKTDCGKVTEGFSRCNVVKGLVIVGWIDTIFLFISLVFIVVLGIIAHRGYGMAKSTLYADA